MSYQSLRNPGAHSKYETESASPHQIEQRKSTTAILKSRKRHEVKSKALQSRKEYSPAMKRQIANKKFQSKGDELDVDLNHSWKSK